MALTQPRNFTRYDCASPSPANSWHEQHVQPSLDFALRAAHHDRSIDVDPAAGLQSRLRLTCARLSTEERAEMLLEPIANHVLREIGAARGAPRRQ